MKLTRTGAAVDAAEVLDDLGGVPVGAADAVGAGVAHHLAAEQVRLGGLAGAAGAGGGDHGDVGLDEAGGERRDDRERRDGRVAAGDGDPPRAAEQVALAGQLGEAVGPRAGVLAAVERLPLRRVGEPEVGAAVDDDGVVAERLRRSRRTGRAAARGTTTSCPARVSTVVSARTRSASGSRCGCSAPSRSPALEPAVSGADLDARGGPGAGAAPLPRRTHWLRRRRLMTVMCMTIHCTACMRRHRGPITRGAASVRPPLPCTGDPLHTRLSPDVYLDHLRAESARFRDVLADCDPAARVPACPDWDAADLLWHLATVQRWWAEVLDGPARAAGGDRPAPPGVVRRPAGAPTTSGRPRWPRRSTARTRRRRPGTGRTTTRSASSSAGRRTRRWCTASTPSWPPGWRSELDARLAADGVHECLDVMYGGCPPWGSWEPGEGTGAGRRDRHR